MKKHIIALAIISSLVMTNLSYAASTQVTETTNDREHTEELVGLSSGVILGAVIGGPVGAFIGAITGTFIGKSVGDESEITAQKSLLDQQQLALDEKNAKLADMDKQQQTLFAVQTELARIQAHQDQTLTELSIGMNVQFKTGSTQIAPLFQQQLDNVAYMMTSMPDLHVNLMGYADRRGNDAFNQALSEQRLLEVTNYLVAQGIDKTRLQGQAYGASAPMHEEQNFENDFFDRRVTLKLIAETEQLAAN
ncbi:MULTISPECIES: sortase-associated OmpA-like protein PdsO [Pseudomonadati]|uniref:Sortase-associated OmpA-like protein PdsO n=1 Tax=Shewanella aestuarii TaxID=1028752 RepID=A0ABT0KY52_9GAMM|nr:sortase-associated OmpA-like protein PdsO [Shewanella aestuarii]MCL1116299.1 sortase-associated OmpA-like protein PdsO [Shewanella aestuarii]GGN71434.1 membrane protein [Shewanella aestuarii]